VAAGQRPFLFSRVFEAQTDNGSTRSPVVIRTTANRLSAAPQPALGRFANGRHDTGDSRMPPKVLIVDDEPNIVVPLEFLMEREGYTVAVAQSGEEALENISKFQPDLILLDIMLPGIDGYEVCEIVRLNSAWNHVRIIFLTAKGREVDIAKGMVLGADAYITKPFSNTTVVRRVNELLSGQ
jgi:CheY-like chemotaxis protein